MSEYETPNDVGESPERVAIRRVIAALRTTLGSLEEFERHIDNPPAGSKRILARGTALALGELGDISHEVRRELLAIHGLYPF